jgi:hypothetical protein
LTVVPADGFFFVITTWFQSCVDIAAAAGGGRRRRDAFLHARRCAHRRDGALSGVKPTAGKPAAYIHKHTRNTC